MPPLVDHAARRAWMDVQSRVSDLRRPNPGPAMGDVFRDGFMRGSMLHLAVCSPGRRAQRRSVVQMLVSSIGRAVAAKASPAVIGSDHALRAK